MFSMVVRAGPDHGNGFVRILIKTRKVILSSFMSGFQTRAESLATRARDHAAGAYIFAQRSLDRVIEPDTRRRAYDASQAFATTRPFIFAAAAALLAFSTLPVLLFTIFAVSVCAIAVGGAILFALFWLGIGFLILIPTLCITSFLALLVWAWAAASFVMARVVYRAIVGTAAQSQEILHEDAGQVRDVRVFPLKQQQQSPPRELPPQYPDQKKGSENGNG
ncbi:hypothetical protein NQ176_g1930 [Zarea fungicola]|uniref:Uncharacterized protein n=1 Tax=Zarea fungicola TaxID=93591 RepID=A0ACC1NRP1_9HYPO|nr:hypothetical protein NQ176_g1930 [Lecanicillium fungicola]